MFTVAVSSTGFNGEFRCRSVMLHTEDGQIEIMDNHADLLVNIGNGSFVLVEQDGSSKSFDATGGVANVNAGACNITAVAIAVR